MSSDSQVSSLPVSGVLVGSGFACLSMSFYALMSTVPSSQMARNDWRTFAQGGAQHIVRQVVIRTDPTPDLPDEGFVQRGEVVFAFGSARVASATAADSLDSVLSDLSLRPCARVVVEGHTDGVGDRHVNLELSRRRGEAVKSWLLRRGVSASRIVVRSFGAYQPKVFAAPESPTQRRVEVWTTACSMKESSP